MKLPKEIWNIIKSRFHDGVEFMIFAELFVAFFAMVCSLLTMYVHFVYFRDVPFPFWTFFLYMFVPLQVIPFGSLIGMMIREVRSVRIIRELRNSAVQH